jgi:hypothetical protein
MKSHVRLNTWIAALVLILMASFSTQGHAGTKEINAIVAKLPAGKTIASATDSELSQAVVLAIADQINIRLNPATIAGEALKGAVTATNIGNALATQILAALATPAGTTGTFPKIAANPQKFVGNASATAATGTLPNPEQIPAWAAVFIAQKAEIDRNLEAITIAKAAIKSKTAVGAVTGGRTLNPDLDTDDERIAFANQALAQLGKSAQQIAAYVGQAAADSPYFASLLTAASTNTKYVVQIATGTTSTNPTDASDIIEALFASDNIASLVFKATVKNATKLATNVSKVADAEEVGQIGETLGARVGLIDPITTKVVGIKQSTVNAIAKGLVLGLTTRATAGLALNSQFNRRDEVVEVGAYLLNSIKGLPVFNVSSTANQKGAANLIIGLMKTIVTNSLKVYSDTPTKPSKPVQSNPQFKAIVAEDLAGTIGLTLRFLQSSFDPAIFAAVQTALLNPNIGAKIAGKSKTTYTVDGQTKTLAAFITDALNTVLSDAEANLTTLDTKYAKYENGTNPVYAQGIFNDPTRGPINDAETDIRGH